MKCLLLLLLLALPSQASFTFFRTMTIDHTKVGSTNQTDFPVQVSIAAQTYIKTVGNGGNVQNSSGFDINFFSNSTLVTKLKWEVEFYDGSAGTLVAWVKIPTVSYTADTVFYMAYDDTTISTFQGDINGTWNSGFLEVFHFPNGTNLSAADSTVTGNNGTITLATAAAGQSDGAGSFSGTGQWVSAFASNISPTGTSRTITAWIKTSSTSREGIAATRPVSGANGWNFILNLTTAGNLTYNHVGGTLITKATGIGTGTWFQVGAVFDIGANAATLYTNGASLGSTGTFGTDASSSFNGIIAAEQGDFSNPFTGQIDEFRISNVVRSADWVLSEYNSISSPSTFITIGSANILGYIKHRVIAQDSGYGVFVLGIGDSVMLGQTGTTNWPLNTFFDISLHSTVPFLSGENRGASAYQVSNLTTDATITDSYYVTGRKNILVIHIGVNDMASTSGTTFVSNLKTFCLARRATGWKIVISTVLPRSDAGAGSEITNRNVANPLIRSDTSFYDALVDLAADTNIGCDSCSANATYYPDHLHPDDAANIIMAALYTAGIQSLL